MISNALHVESPFPSALPNIRIEGNSIHTPDILQRRLR